MEHDLVSGVDEPGVRPLRERQEAARARLRAGGNLWLATANGLSGPHLIPVSFWWDGARLTTSTFESSRTLDNVQEQPKVRASIGTTTDVLMIDATACVVRDDEIEPAAAEGYAEASGIPRATPGFVYIQLLPRRMQVWSGREEFADRTVMRGGVWLD